MKERFKTGLWATSAVLVTGSILLGHDSHQNAPELTLEPTKESTATATPTAEPEAIHLKDLSQIYLPIEKTAFSLIINNPDGITPIVILFEDSSTQSK